MGMTNTEYTQQLMDRLRTLEGENTKLTRSLAFEHERAKRAECSADAAKAELRAANELLQKFLGKQP